MKNGKSFALSLIAAAFLLLLTACGSTGQTAAETSTPAPSGGVLMEGTDTRSLSYDSPVFGSPTLTRSEIRSITFLSDTSNAPAESWDVSQSRDGSVIAWAVANGKQGKSSRYTLYIASDGGVIAPENCAEMFSGYYNVESIAFNSAFDTSNVTDMSNMFYCCWSLTALDVSGFNTSRVTNTSEMFHKCEGLTTLDISGFDTSNVKNAMGMFYECRAVTEEDISKLDLSNVPDIDHIFCTITENHPALKDGTILCDGRTYNAGQ